MFAFATVRGPNTDLFIYLFIFVILALIHFIHQIRQDWLYADLNDFRIKTRLYWFIFWLIESIDLPWLTYLQFNYIDASLLNGK